ncbi:hypothetical protein [Rhizobium sp. RAF56]|uniref:hypothetical protein n=1 Tax=Rhizobium sp. RAF56 TaxID=3233062 RepID=UPI003F9C1609
MTSLRWKLKKIFRSGPKPSTVFAEPSFPKPITNAELRERVDRYVAVSARYVCSGLSPSCCQVMAFGQLNATCDACGTKFVKGGRWA